MPVLQHVKNVSAVEVRSSSLQPASHGFLDCLVSLAVATSRVIFQGLDQVVVSGGQIRAVVRMGEQLPDVCSSVPVSKRGNPTGTNLKISQNLHHLLDRMVPHSTLRCNFSDCCPSVLSDELVDFLLVAAVLGRTQRG
jgi:hypothetical protein